MRLSTKHTHAFLVLSTWPDARMEFRGFGREDEAEIHAKWMRKGRPDAFVQVHKIQQALPQEPK